MAREKRKTVWDVLPNYLASYVHMQTNTEDPLEAVRSLCDSGQPVLAVAALNLALTPSGGGLPLATLLLVHPSYKIIDCALVKDSSGDEGRMYFVAALRLGGEHDSVCMVIEEGYVPKVGRVEYVARPCTAREHTHAVTILQEKMGAEQAQL